MQWRRQRLGGRQRCELLNGALGGGWRRMVVAADNRDRLDAHCIGVGWDRKLYDWSLAADEDEDENRPIVSKPQPVSSLSHLK